MAGRQFHHTLMVAYHKLPVVPLALLFTGFVKPFDSPGRAQHTRFLLPVRPTLVQGKGIFHLRLIVQNRGGGFVVAHEPDTAFTGVSCQPLPGQSSDIGVVKSKTTPSALPFPVPSGIPSFNQYMGETMLCGKIDIATGIFRGCSMVARRNPMWIYPGAFPTRFPHIWKVQSRKYPQFYWVR